MTTPENDTPRSPLPFDEHLYPTSLSDSEWEANSDMNATPPSRRVARRPEYGNDRDHRGREANLRAGFGALSTRVDKASEDIRRLQHDVSTIDGRVDRIQQDVHAFSHTVEQRFASQERNIATGQQGMTTEIRKSVNEIETLVRNNATQSTGWKAFLGYLGALGAFLTVSLFTITILIRIPGAEAKPTEARRWLLWIGQFPGVEPVDGYKDTLQKLSDSMHTLEQAVKTQQGTTEEHARNMEAKVEANTQAIKDGTQWAGSHWLASA